ncbi:hypothetical protein [Sporomusa ovata]|uniref:Uncharacterized protein n=1 Tax=Sporomusa ovata TaxID=2378 RepID=A0A0U1L119_9FIRM|nr:hypothetical protein [Sporomusa ovata]CQR73029.1 hypothetical protein SpAn4DRAFT_2261 [Sporomusa ovata]
MSGYIAGEFDKLVPAPGIDWQGDEKFWLTNARNQGWIIQTMPENAKVGAIIIGSDDSRSTQVGIIRKAEGNFVVIETLSKKQKLLLLSIEYKNLEEKFGFYGYIWPEKSMDGQKSISRKKLVLH